jgi:hypothetical protein
VAASSSPPVEIDSILVDEGAAPVRDPDHSQHRLVVELELGLLGAELLEELAADLPLPQHEERDAVLRVGPVDGRAARRSGRLPPPTLAPELGHHVREPVDVDEERVVAVRRVEDGEPRVRHERSDLALLPRPVEDVRVDRDDERRLANGAQHVVEVAPRARHVVRVHRLRQGDVRRRIEAIDEQLALVAQVALDRVDVLGLRTPREALLERRLASVREHRHHSRRGEARLGRIGGIVRPPAPARVGVDRLPLRLRQADAPRRVAGGRGDEHHRLHERRVAERPLQRLHAAERAADDHPDSADPQHLGERMLDADHVADGDRRERAKVGLSRRRIERRRPGGAVTAPEDVRADDEVA